MSFGARPCKVLSVSEAPGTGLLLARSTLQGFFKKKSYKNNVRNYNKMKKKSSKKSEIQ
jgi:hypothetical protein